MNCYVCAEPATNECKICSKPCCERHGVFWCKPCEVLFLGVIGRLGTVGEERLGTDEGIHARMLQLAEPSGVRLEDVPTVEQLRAFRAKGPEIQRNLDRVIQEAASKRMKATTLLRVLPVAQTAVAGAEEATLISLELYDDGFCVRWRIRSLAEEGWRRFPHMVVSVEDDLGTAYASQGSGAGGHGGGLAGDAWFAPSVDPGARSLAVRLDEIVIAKMQGQDVGLIGKHARAFAGTPPRFGPWEFEVAL